MHIGSQYGLVMESLLDGSPHIEREITCYVKLKDLYDVTSIAKSIESHEQWRLMTNSKKGGMRIRLTDDVEYSLTAKETTNNQFEVIESEQKISRSFFETLKKCFAYDGYLKTRYNIPIPETDRKWEVDVFKGYDGLPSMWVKLDYEFNETETQLPEIPFDYEDIIIGGVEEGREEEIKKLWEESWAKLDEKDT